jgi:hypothetical protein
MLIKLKNRSALSIGSNVYDGKGPAFSIVAGVPGKVVK